MSAKRTFRRWYNDALHSYQAGYRQAFAERTPTHVVKSRASTAAFERGDADGATARRDESFIGWPDELPIDLWTEVIALSTADWWSW